VPSSGIPKSLPPLPTEEEGEPSSDVDDSGRGAPDSPFKSFSSEDDTDSDSGGTGYPVS